MRIDRPGQDRPAVQPPLAQFHRQYIKGPLAPGCTLGGSSKSRSSKEAELPRHPRVQLQLVCEDEATLEAAKEQVKAKLGWQVLFAHTPRKMKRGGFIQYGELEMAEQRDEPDRGEQRP